MVLDPIHYLATFGRRPGALDHSPVYRDPEELPDCFGEFRADLENQYGTVTGTQQFMHVLQLQPSIRWSTCVRPWRPVATST